MSETLHLPLDKSVIDLRDAQEAEQKSGSLESLNDAAGLWNQVEKQAESLQAPGSSLETAKHFIEKMHDHSKETACHCMRVALGTVAAAKLLGANEQDALFAGLLHDGGKMDESAVPKELLEKSVRGTEAWTAEDRAAMSNHSKAGYEMALALGYSKQIALAIGTHHRNQKFPSGMDDHELTPETRRLRDSVTIADFIDARFSRKDGWGDTDEQAQREGAIEHIKLVLDHEIYSDLEDKDSLAQTMLERLLNLRAETALSISTNQVPELVGAK